MHESRTATLEQRHGTLDRRIMAEARSPGSDDLAVSRMKRERLSLKDRLAGMQA